MAFLHAQGLGAPVHHNVANDGGDYDGHKQHEETRLQLGLDVEASDPAWHARCDGGYLLHKRVQPVALVADDEQRELADLEDRCQNAYHKDVQRVPRAHHLGCDQPAPLPPARKRNGPQHHQQGVVGDHHQHREEAEHELDPQEVGRARVEVRARYLGRQRHHRKRAHGALFAERQAGEPQELELESLHVQADQDEQQRERQGADWAVHEGAPSVLALGPLDVAEAGPPPGPLSPDAELSNLVGAPLHHGHDVAQHQGAQRGEHEDVEAPFWMHVHKQAGRAAKLVEGVLDGLRGLLRHRQIEFEGYHEQHHDKHIHQRPLPQGVEPLQHCLPALLAHRHQPAAKHREQLHVGPYAAEETNKQRQRIRLAVPHVHNAAYQGEADARKLHHLSPVGFEGHAHAHARTPEIRLQKQRNVRDHKDRQGKHRECGHAGVQPKAIPRWLVFCAPGSGQPARRHLCQRRVGPCAPLARPAANRVDLDLRPPSAEAPKARAPREILHSASHESECTCSQQDQRCHARDLSKNGRRVSVDGRGAGGERGQGHLVVHPFVHRVCHGVLHHRLDRLAVLPQEHREHYVDHVVNVVQAARARPWLH
mmetsp:Transcript_119327/g.320279  ORF Transcript_119327/g.320279 Transcript_119327/m.320279 type:complete len:595 (+) Transcript_119327:534-2318(+)